MNVQNLQENYPHLLSYMEENGYSAIYIKRFKVEINRMLKDVKSHDWKTYEDVYLSYVKRFKSKATLSGKRSIIGIIKRFDLENIFPHPLKKTVFFKESNYSLLSEEFKHVIDTYCIIAKQNGKKEATIYTESNILTRRVSLLYLKPVFLFFLKTHANAF